MTVSYPDGCYILSVAALVLSTARLLHLFTFMRLLRYVSSSLQDGLMTGILQASVSRHCRVLAAQGYSKNGASDEGDTMQSIVAHCVAAYSWMI